MEWVRLPSEPSACETFRNGFDDALRAAVTALPRLPRLVAGFVEADCRIGDDHDGYSSVWGSGAELFTHSSSSSCCS